MTLTNNPNRTHRIATVWLAALLIVLAVGTMSGIAGAQETTEPPTEPELRINVHENNSAHVTLVVTFDLATENEQDAFEILRNNTTAQEQRISHYESYFRGIANRTETHVDREMQIHRPTIQFTTRNDTGIVALTVKWDGLAVKEGQSIVLQEPFASGFTPDRSFTVTAPAGYHIDAATPTPSSESRGEASWANGTSLDGFEVTFVRDASVTPTDSALETPGFGVILAIIAIISGGLLIRYTRKQD